MTVPLFSGLSAFELRQLVDSLETLTFAPGEEICREGEPAGDLYVILSGTATVTRNGQDRPPMAPGGFIGELSILRQKPRTATVTAQTMVVAVKLMADDFMNLLQEDWKAARSVLEILAERIADDPHL